MTTINPEGDLAGQNLYIMNNHPRVAEFFSQTIGENNIRIDGLGSIDDLRTEIKLIEGILLGRFTAQHLAET